MRTLYICPKVSSPIYLLFFVTYSQPSQTDVYHTSTHGVALVQI